MAIRMRFTVRGLILLVALCACALAAAIYPHQQYERLKHRWEVAIQSYEGKRPPYVNPHGWNELIGLAYTVWGNSLPYSRVPNNLIEPAVARLEADAARATPETAAGLLVRSLDLLLEIRPDNERFIRVYQADIRDGLAQEAQKARAARGPVPGSAAPPSQAVP